MESFRDGCYSSANLALVCKITPVPQMNIVFILMPFFYITLGSANLPILKACTHPLSSITLFALCRSLEKNSICASWLLMRERDRCGHLHKDLLKKLLKASGLHAWGTFLKTHRVYQGFLYIECRNTISYIECIMSYQTYFLYTINKSDATRIWWRITVDMLSFLGLERM